jgi:hypothetical protein
VQQLKRALKDHDLSFKCPQSVFSCKLHTSHHIKQDKSAAFVGSSAYRLNAAVLILPPTITSTLLYTTSEPDMFRLVRPGSVWGAEAAIVRGKRTGGRDTQEFGKVK